MSTFPYPVVGGDGVLVDLFDSPVWTCGYCDTSTFHAPACPGCGAPVPTDVGGTAFLDTRDTEPCPTCSGRGLVEHPLSSGHMPIVQPCIDCDGTGHLDTEG